MYSGPIRPSVQYDRKIRYLDYMENGQRLCGAGFIKLERRDGLCNISLQVNGLYRRDRLIRPFLMIGEGGERELCKLQLTEGGLKSYFEALDSRDLGGQGIGYDELRGIRIPISDGKEIRCVWSAESQRVAEAAETPGETMRLTEEETLEEAETVQREIAEVSEEAEAKQHKEAETQMPLREDKWEQLWTIYPHVRPFSDEREYLSVGLNDFVLLHRNSYKLVSNSFLLHGFYNFHHLILLRNEGRNGATFYIGVPGNLYEREKKTAIMFGFKSFECAEEPARDGDFGYYLIPVEL